MKTYKPIVDLNDQLLEDTYSLLKRSRTDPTEQDCCRWTILWTMLNADPSDLWQMCDSVVKIDLEGRRRRMGKENTND